MNSDLKGKLAKSLFAIGSNIFHPQLSLNLNSLSPKSDWHLIPP